MRKSPWSVVLCTTLSFAAWAGAEPPDSSEPGPSEPGSPPAASRASPAKAASSASTDAAVADALEGVTESPDKTYLFFGMRYRYHVIPKFIVNLFADGGTTVTAHTPGLEFGVRKDGFEYGIFGMLDLYSEEDVPFKGSSDENTAWEIIDGSYQILYLGSDFMWSSDELAEGLSLVYGAGLGLGLVFGELNRTQAFPRDLGDEGNPDVYARCISPGNPMIQSYCGNDNDHYSGYVEPSWANGGSSPLIWAWISGQFGLRYKVHRNLVMRFEAGLLAVPTGLFLGGAVDYGL